VFTAIDAIPVALLCVLVILLALIGVGRWRRSRVSPEEKERRRRAILVARGKMGDADLVEIRDSAVVYSYAVRGVEYTAAQDITAIRDLVPQDLAALGPVLMKYDPRNPANSIVLAEEWNGLQFASAAQTRRERPPARE
jgi:hypothetical protein